MLSLVFLRDDEIMCVSDEYLEVLLSASVSL